MIVLPEDVGRFTFVRMASLRAAQLIRGCTPRVVAADKPTTTAQREVRAGVVSEAIGDEETEPVARRAMPAASATVTGIPTPRS